ncbi:hypothetical protein [Echinicola salinicaeni]|uniref:hypothetical protein n=1 Tax=Echinicola salinicaeni TaxID=2762757 RepID=UPI001646E622|nr:hypothetical protein [Echinicola salinicaeni]
MKTIGIILIIAGIAMFFVTGFSFTTEETVIDAGPIELSAEKEKNVNWPPYAGGASIIAGLIFLGLSKKK